MNGCIIVPYRDRAEHLAKFVPHYRDVLPIIVVEQCDNKPFNRAKLLNVGFLELGKDYDYCIMHDVDMLARDFYPYTHYPDAPIHLATACSQFNYKMPYSKYFGGVTSVSSIDMQAVNGFPNYLFGWGKEDDVFRERCATILNELGYFPNNIYDCFDHPREIDLKLYEHNLSLSDDLNDGLTSCKYELLSTEQKDGYTLIRVNL